MLEQPRILKEYEEASSENRLLYVCACCGERNFKTTGEYRLVSIAQLEPLRYNAGIASDMARWELLP